MDDRILLPKSRISPGGWAQIREALSTNTSLESFSLQQSELTDAVVPDLCTFLRKNKTVEYFEFNQSRFSDDGMGRILQAFLSNTTLIALQIHDSPLSDAVVPDICRAVTENRTLEGVQFYKSKFSDDGMRRILQSFLNNRRLTHLSIWESVLSDAVVPDICKVVTENTTLEGLQFHQCVFTDDGMSKICQAFLSSRTLRICDIYDSTLSDVVIPDICKVVTENTTLQNLQLFRSKFSDDGMSRILQAFCNNKTLTHFCIWESVLSDAVVPDICKVVTENTTLQNLQLLQSKFSDDGMSRMLQTFSNNKTLTQFCIWESALSDAVVPDICKVVTENTTLETLQLEQSRFSDDGMKRIIQSLLKNQTVTHFRITYSVLTDAVVGEICAFFEDTHMQKFNLGNSCTFTDKWMPELLTAFRNNKSLRSVNILGHGPLTDECLPSLTAVVGKRTTLLEIVSVQQGETCCLKLVKSEGTGPLYYHAWTVGNEVEFLLPAQYLQEGLTEWLESNRVASAISIKENKLVLFLPQEQAEPLKVDFLQKLKAIPTTFHDCYKIQIIDKPLELAQHSKCGPGSKLYMEAEDKVIYSSAGALLRASNGILYLMSACHGARVHECYMEEPAEEGSDRILVGTCVYNEFKKSPALLDACLFEIQNTDLREECDPFLPEPMEKSALCGPYGRLIVDLADKPGEEASALSNSTPVMKFGQASKLTEGELVYYDFSEPSLQIKGALVIEPVEEEGVFAKEGDSGSVIFMKSPQEGDSASDVTLYEALAVHCFELRNLKKNVKVSLAFQLDHAITIFEEKIGKKLQLMKTW